MASQRPPSGMGRPMSRSGSVLPSSAKPPTAVRPPTAIRVGTSVRGQTDCHTHRHKGSVREVQLCPPSPTDGSRYRWSSRHAGLHHQDGSSVCTDQSDRQAGDPAGAQWDEDWGER